MMKQCPQSSLILKRQFDNVIIWSKLYLKSKIKMSFNFLQTKVTISPKRSHHFNSYRLIVVEVWREIVRPHSDHIRHCGEKQVFPFI